MTANRKPLISESQLARMAVAARRERQAAYSRAIGAARVALKKLERAVVDLPAAAPDYTALGDIEALAAELKQIVDRVSRTGEYAPAEPTTPTYAGKPIEWNRKCTGAWYALINGVWREAKYGGPLSPEQYVTVNEVRGL